MECLCVKIYSNAKNVLKWKLNLCIAICKGNEKQFYLGGPVSFNAVGGGGGGGNPICAGQRYNL